jgi:hypothetical protein
MAHVDVSGTMDADPLAVICTSSSRLVSAGNVIPKSTVFEKSRLEHVLNVPAAPSGPEPVPCAKQLLQSPE